MELEASKIPVDSSNRVKSLEAVVPELEVEGDEAVAVAEIRGVK